MPARALHPFGTHFERQATFRRFAGGIAATVSLLITTGNVFFPRADSTLEETTMKYLALIYSSDAQNPQYGSPKFAAVVARDRVMLAGEGLQPTTTATTVRVRKGKTESMDGPFAETKEQLGGFYLFDCANLDEAIKYAAMIPHAAWGSVEVRPVMQYG
jgi:hypothetical protein